jgi:hypothetical protein
MDGRAVSKVVGDLVWPAMRSAGFTEFTGRKAWRFNNQTIDMIALRSFSSYIASGVGCTTCSFALTSGVFYRCLDIDLSRPDTCHLTFSFECPGTGPTVQLTRTNGRDVLRRHSLSPPTVPSTFRPSAISSISSTAKTDKDVPSRKPGNADIALKPYAPGKLSSIGIPASASCWIRNWPDPSLRFPE